MVDYIPVDLLRKKLGELEQQKKLSFDEIKKLRAEFPHSIQLPEQSPQEMVDLPFINCAMYAFNLKSDDWYRAIADGPGIIRKNPSRATEPDYSISADTEFVDYCINKRLVSAISGRELESGDLVVYSDIDWCRHVGKLVRHGRIRSKWGTIDLFEHELFEVPDIYGHKHQYFEGLGSERAQQLFIRYAWSVVDDDPQIRILLKSAINTYS